MTRKEFVQYLETTLIPDLIDSGREATASDFAVAIRFIEDPGVDEVDQEQVDYEINAEADSLWLRQQMSDRDKEDGIY
jgi:hypothetical protein